ncbi:MAG: MFS transporter [Xanthobacteraceae bacterium]
MIGVTIGLRAAITIGITAILLLALAVVGWGVDHAVDRVVAPQIALKAESVGRSAAGLVSRALEAGVPLDGLVGVEDYLGGLRRAHGELAGIALLGPDGASLVTEGALPPGARLVDTPVVAQGAGRATLRIAIDPQAVAARTDAVLIDVGFIGLVALLMALELVALVIGTRGAAALHAIEERLRRLGRGRLGRQAGESALAPALDALHARHDALKARAKAIRERRALHELQALEQRTGVAAQHSGESLAAEAVRPALFLFMLAEELTRPFLPRLVQSLAPRDGLLGIDVAISLPIVIFMGIVALCQLPFSAWSERLGRRRGFVIGAALAAAGHVGAASVDSYVLFVAARSLAAFGFALVFVSAQGHVIERSRPQQRAQGLAGFVRAIMVAAVCGPPIGGVIADRLGDQTAFFASAGLAVAALLLAFVFLPADPGHAPREGGAFAGLAGAVRAPRLAPLLFGCAFPAKFLLAALSFYLLPVALERQGYSAADIGRLQMIYPIIMVACVPLFAALADRLKARAAFVALGGLVAGGGVLALAPFSAGLWPLALILVLLGLGQAASIAPQSALVAEIALAVPGSSAGVLGLFRLVERLGNAAGPAVASVMLAGVGFTMALGGIGAMVAAGAAAFALAQRQRPATASDPEDEPEDSAAVA